MRTARERIGERSAKSPAKSLWGPRKRDLDRECWHQRGSWMALSGSDLSDRPDSEERTGIRFEKERVYGYSGGAKALPGRPLAPAIAPIRGSRR